MSQAASRHPPIVRSFPQFLHGGDYNPEQWLDRPDVLEQDRQLMPLAGCNAFSINIFGWSTVEPREGEYHFDHLDATFDRIASFGGKVFLATPSGARPPWMHARYPTTARVNKEGRRSAYYGRHNHCWSSPDFRRLVEAMNTRLAERYKSHAALALWHISNEFSGECFCDLCRARFTRWLEEKYTTVDALNRAWWTSFWSHRYNRFDEIEPTDPCVEGMHLDWRRFQTWQMCEWIDFEAAPLRRITPNVPVTTNFMGTFHQVDYSEVAKHIDVVCDDQYPNYDADSPHFIRAAATMGFRNDYMRGLLDKPFFLMEATPSTLNWSPPAKLKRPNQHLLEMTQAIAHGADGTMYFQWRAGRGAGEKFHGAVVEHYSSPEARVFKEVRSVGDRLKKIAPLVGTRTEARVALVYDMESRWAISQSQGPQVDLSKFNEVCVDHYEPLWKRGIAVDVVRADRDLSHYDLVILPQTWIVTQAFADRVREFVERGGTLIATHDTGVCDEFNRVHQYGWPGCGLQEVFGLVVEEVDRTKPGETFPLNAVDPQYDGPELIGRDVKALAHLRTAKPLLTYAADFMAGMPAVTVNAFGAGQAYFIGTRLSAVLLDRLYAIVGQSLPRAIDATLPHGVIVNERVAGDEQFVVVQNYTRAPKTVAFDGPILVDLETAESFVRELPLAPLGSRVLRKKP
jgi:beta-galactosidase